VSHLVTVPQAYVMIEASQLDSYGLQFSKPTFISLDPNASVANLADQRGVRVGVERRPRRKPARPTPPARPEHRLSYTAGAGTEYVQRSGYR
jgi:hypothetical protein